MSGRDVRADPWAPLRRFTRARIGLESAGDALTTQELLKFQLDHAHARDAVHGSVDWARLAAELKPEFETLEVHSCAPDRTVYLRRPDFGRRLMAESARMLAARAGSPPWEVVFVIADGLSSAAVERHAVPTLRDCMARLVGWHVAPIVLAQQARVGLGDAICLALDAQAVIILIGERPGLSVPDSLGMYLTWAPRAGQRDSERNCISNIHRDGLSYATAGVKAAWLLTEMRRVRISGTVLKEDPAAIEQFRLQLERKEHGTRS